MSLPSGLTAFQQRGTSGLIATAQQKAIQGVKTTGSIKFEENIFVTALKGFAFPFVFGLNKLGLTSNEYMVTYATGSVPVKLTSTYTLNEKKVINEKQFGAKVVNIINWQKENIEGAKKFWEDIPNVPDLPDPKDYTKWILYGFIAVLGVYLLGKYIGGKK